MRDMSDGMMHRHVQMDRRIGIGLARLQKRTGDAAIFPAWIKQNPRACSGGVHGDVVIRIDLRCRGHSCYRATEKGREDRKSTRLNSSHVSISYAVFCLKKKKNI